MLTRDTIHEQIKQGNVEVSEGGILLPAVGGRAVGMYMGSHNEGPWENFFNAITLEFVDYMFQASINNDTRFAQWYMTLFGPGVTPVEGWTAASFAALAVENDDPANGYVSTTRPAVSFDPSDQGLIANAANAVRFTFASTGPTIEVGGVAIMSDAVRGGSAGIMASAANLNNTRQFEDGDTYDVIYGLRITST